jgi:hypothetical protein
MHNISVFVEKPLAPTAQECINLYRLSNDLTCGYIELYNPIIKNIDSLQYAGFWRFSNAVNDTHVIYDLAVHDLAVYLSLTGYPERIKCRGNFNSVEITLDNTTIRADRTKAVRMRGFQINHNIKGDYMEQRLWIDDKEVKIRKTDKLKDELVDFLNGKYIDKELVINTSKIAEECMKQI